MKETSGLFKYLDSSKLNFFEKNFLLLTPPKYLNDPWDFLPKGRIPSEDEILKICVCFKDARVLSFGNGDQAWQELLRVEPDLFMTDIHHPGKLYAGKMLQLLAEKKVKFPILVASGLATEKEVRQCAGSDLNLLFLKKPFTTEVFFGVLEAKLKISRDYI